MNAENTSLTAIEKQLLQAFRLAEPIYQSVALEVLQMHPAQRHKPQIEHAGGNVVKISWGEEHSRT